MLMADRPIERQATSIPPRKVTMLGTFGVRPKGTLRARALAMARVMRARGWESNLITTPWDNPEDSGQHWYEAGIQIVNTRFAHPALWPLASGEMIYRTRASKPDIVHLFKPKGFGDLAARGLRRFVPVVVDMDDWEGDGGWNDSGLYSPLQARIFDWQERTWPAQAAAVTVASRELFARALSLGASEDRVFYVPNGLSAERIALLDPARASGRDVPASITAASGPKILLYTRFVEFSPASLAPLLMKLRSHFPTIRLVIAGASIDGSAEKTLRYVAQELGLEQQIIQLGWVETDLLPALSHHCELAIHPFDDNTINRSKCSVKLLELMASGIPVIASRVGENAAFIEHERSGFLVEPGDTDALAGSVVRLLRHREALVAVRQAARERVQRNYRWEDLVAAVEHAYQRACEQR